jgi:fusion and transport protein UGO1
MPDMSTHRDGVNPLRPYYIPPTIGERAEPVSSPSPNPFSGSGSARGSGYASRARDVLTDLDYNTYLGDDTPSVVQNVKDLLDELLWKYTSVRFAIRMRALRFRRRLSRRCSRRGRRATGVLFTM